MVNVFIAPNYATAPKNADNGGIRRVVEAELKHLAQFGINVVTNPSDADVFQFHGTSMVKPKYLMGKPIVHTSHGLMWSRQKWEEDMQQVNQDLVESMAWAVAHTAPSEWVSRAIRRGGLWYPEVVYHGVDAQDFQISPDHGNYVLWNKARTDFVSNPNDLMTLSNVLPNVQFVTTYGRNAPNVKVLGITPQNPMPHDEMQKIVARAGVYLATARETFGIGTLEAMALGIPICGWAWGGQEEIIVQGQTGYLAPPGNYRALAECVQLCFQERERLGANARADVETRWGWEPRIEQYANLFKRIYTKYSTPRPSVSVIVTTYKLDKYLPAALDSMLRQVYDDWECIVIDDAHSNETWKIVESYTQKDSRFQYVPTPHNFGLVGARNFGFTYAKGKYIRHLDADDWLHENCLKIEAETLDREPGMHIVYGHLEVVQENGDSYRDERGTVPRSGWPPDQFDWVGQLAHLNQLPSCVMARREVFERSGGYRERMRRNEDAEFWCRVTSLGFRARKISQAALYYHRQRDDSKGNLEWKTEGKEPDWTAWFPWRVGAGDYQDAVSILRRFNGMHPAPHLVPFGAQGQAPRRRFWYVHDFAYPVVSVVVTVGPGHESYVLDALDSLWAQSYPDWECVVVNDTGKDWDRDFMGAPWAKVVNMNGNEGASAARNAGYHNTRGKYVIWMDCDDIWLPWFLEVMVAHAERNDGIIFSDVLLEKQGGIEVYRFPDFSDDQLAGNMRYAGTSVLVPRKIAQALFDLQSGWDTQIPGKEDHDFQIAVHSMGYCAYHIKEPLFVYRMYSSTKREKDFAKIDIIGEYLNNKWRAYRLEGKRFMCGCGATNPTNNIPSSLLSSSGDFDITEGKLDDGTPTQMVNVEYIGDNVATFSVKSRVQPGVMYRFGNNPGHKEKTVFLGDAEFLLTLRNGDKPQYRALTRGARMEQRDPAAVLGQAIQAG